MSARIRPKQGQVLLRMELPQEVSDGGILIPENARERAQIGKVVRCGIWRQNKRGSLIPYECKAGDTVVINGRSGRWLKTEKLGLKIVDMDKVLAVIP